MGQYCLERMTLKKKKKKWVHKRLEFLHVKQQPPMIMWQVSHISLMPRLFKLGGITFICTMMLCCFWISNGSHLRVVLKYGGTQEDLVEQNKQLLVTAGDRSYSTKAREEKLNINQQHRRRSSRKRGLFQRDLSMHAPRVHLSPTPFSSENYQEPYF